MSRINFREITSRLSELNRKELRELKSIIEALLEIEIKTQNQIIERRYNGVGKSKAGGYVERKMIRGYGPYLYLRYWSRKRLKSVYIGKATKQ